MVFLRSCVQIPGLQLTQAQANQSNIVTVGQLCIDVLNAALALRFFVQEFNFRLCGQNYAKRPLGGTVQVTTTQTNKFDDQVINTHTKSVTKQIVTTTNSVLPVTGRAFQVRFTHVGRVEITFELRSPNAFLSYLGSWYKVGDSVPFSQYDSIPARTIYQRWSLCGDFKMDRPVRAIRGSITTVEYTACLWARPKHPCLWTSL